MISGLLITHGPPAFAQGERGGARPPTEAARQAEVLFQSALFLPEGPEHQQERQSARLRLQEAMRLWVQAGEPEKAAKAALQMADLEQQALYFAEALDDCKRALAIKRLPGLIRSNALRALALIYAELYQNDLALRYFNKALDQARAIHDSPAQALALTGLANLYYRQGERTQALACVVRARQLNGKRNPTEAALLYLLGQVSRDEGLLKKAEDAFAEALAIYRETDDAGGQIKVLCAASDLALLASQQQTALDQAKQAVELAEAQAKRAMAVSHAAATRARELRWRARLSCARAQRALGQTEPARSSYFWAVNHFEAVWWAVYIATEASAIASREEAQAAYREYVDVLMEQGRFKDAYDVMEEARSRTVLNFTFARQAAPHAADSHQEATRRESSRLIARLRQQLLAPNVSLREQAKLQKEIEDAEYEMREQEVRAEIEYSIDRLFWLNLATTDSLRKRTAEDQMALVEFSLGESRSFAWLFAHGKFYVETLPPRKQIEKDVRSYLDRLAATPNHLCLERDLTKLREQAEGLFATLLGGLFRQVEPGERLIIVPDGLLYYLPFETLIHNGHYLLEGHEISYVPSASMLGLWQDSKTQADGADKMDLLAVGDPLLSSGAVAVGGKNFRGGPRHQTRRMIAPRALDLAPLPQARDEVHYIASLFRPDHCKVFLGGEGTEAAIKRESLRRYRRLHFATHSLIDEKSPWRSAVVLTPADEAGEDGFLEAGEISRLDLDCDLVVVSACQTGRGQLLTGEGIVGLSRSFLYAGARAVVVSLWNVTDISTGQLMKKFYQNLAGGMSNAAALREAKLKLLGSGKAMRHPHYWSSFIITGKP